ncbi:uncharacterized protein [Macrobrachium rosenbergii]|uniref:uncharacterized protein n=1 Tax=Macrobrachium rosenbergii TaxID=79674 RepID=UPI0034D7AD78
MKKLKAILSTSESAICISLNEKDVCIDMEAIFELTNSQNADIDPLSHLYVDNDENKVIVESLGVPTDIEFEGCEFLEQGTTSDNPFTCSIDLPFEDWNDLDDSSNYTAETLLFDQNESDLNGSLHQTPLSSEVKEEPPRRRRRGRRPKAEALLYPSLPRGSRPKKHKLYEMAQPFQDEMTEKRRQNAINAKKHRDQTKGHIQSLRSQIEEVKKETEELSKLSQKLTDNIKLLQQFQGTLRERVLDMTSHFPQGSL